MYTTLNEYLNNIKIWYHGTKRDYIKLSDRSENVDYNMMGFGIYLTSKKEEAIYYGKEKNGFLFTIELLDSNILQYSKPIPENIKNDILKDENFYDLFDNIKNDDFDFEQGFYENETLQISWDLLDLDVDKPLWAKKLKNGYFVVDDKKDKILIDGLDIEDCSNFIINLISKNAEIEFVRDLLYVPSKFNDYVLTKKNVFNSPYHLMNYLYLKFKSLKSVSSYLLKFDIDGVINKIDTSDYGYGAKVCVVFNQEKINIISTKKL